MYTPVKKGLVLMGGLGALALGGAAVASATTSGTSSTSTTSPSTTSPSTTPGWGGGPAPGTAAHEDAEKAVTGAIADKARAAAIKALGGGTAGAVTTDYRGNGYEVTVTKSDGTSSTVHLTSALQVMTAPAGRPGRGPGPNGRPGPGPNGRSGPGMGGRLGGGPPGAAASSGF
jgi:hypothetical protein